MAAGAAVVAAVDVAVAAGRMPVAPQAVSDTPVAVTAIPNTPRFILVPSSPTATAGSWS
jgi:hypothetical protein